MFDTAQERAAASCVGIGVTWPAYLATGAVLDQPGRAQVAGSYRYTLEENPEFEGELTLESSVANCGALASGNVRTVNVSVGGFEQ